LNNHINNHNVKDNDEKERDRYITGTVCINFSDSSDNLAGTGVQYVVREECHFVRNDPDFRRKTRYGQLLAAGIFFCQFSGVYGGSRGVLPTGASH
jgi:hypothetical protein